MNRCSGKAFFTGGHSIGWDALEDLGDDAQTARCFVEQRVLPVAFQDEKITVYIKESLGSPVRSAFEFDVRGLQQAKILSQTPV